MRNEKTNSHRCRIVYCRNNTLYYMECCPIADRRPLSPRSFLPTITAEINAYKRVAGEAIFEIGRRLKSVRDAKIDSSRADERNLARQREEAGGWIRWLEEHVDFDRSQAHRFITVFEELGDVGTYQRFGLRALYEIATLPPEERTREHTLKSGVTKTVDEMTVRE
ncbi:DUF3102 domain-containing protein [Paenibacillus phoenicis]|uniref:DUF3102 domain-containing protein n=1 Tax=Paenibacillus phoenicis TaxID=554117 RepID=A0ABU5PPA8_9BACL|nr:DUF3102 domain-containing protein [Paenibacillus phoenicis]MEA3571786.1 DUF3102 domain-containing protein [Paenibacillus phoenicis]